MSASEFPQQKLFTVTYRHFRVYRDQQMHHKGGVTLALGFPADDHDEILVAAAVCSDNDMYSHVEGRRRAYARLMNGGQSAKLGDGDGLHIAIHRIIGRPTPEKLTRIATAARKLTNCQGGRLVGKGQWGSYLSWSV